MIVVVYTVKCCVNVIVVSHVEMRQNGHKANELF